MRQFGIISSSVWRSKRFRQLESDLACLTYIYLHTTTHGNSAGAFIVSPEIAALEMKRDPVQVRAAFEELAEVKLIRYDPEEELVQIINFFKFNSPTSRKHLAGPLRIINDALPSSPVRDAAAVELVLSMHERASGWANNVEAKGVFLQEAATIIKTLHLEAMLCGPEFGLEIDLLIGLSNDLLITLPIQEQGKDQGDNKTTDKTTETTRRQQDHGAGSAKSGVSAQRGPPSSPAEGSQSGRSKVPSDVQADIDALSARARGAKQ